MIESRELIEMFKVILLNLKSKYLLKKGQFF